MSSKMAPPRGEIARALEHWSRVLGFARSLVGEPALAEDLCQEAYLRLMERADRIDFERSVLPLLLTIVRNLAVSEFRRERPGSLPGNEDGDFDVQDEKAEDPAQLASRAESHSTLRDALGCLPKNWRAALYLKDGLSFSYRQIGEIIESSEDTVRTMLHRARQRLRQLLSERKAQL